MRTGKLSAELYARLLGGLACAYIGWNVSRSYAHVPPTADEQASIALLTLVSIGLGIVLTPYVVVRPVRALLHHARHMPSHDLVATGIGVFLGLLASVLLTIPLSHLPLFLGQYLPFASALLCAYIGAVIVNWRKNDLLALFSRHSTTEAARRYLLDTSVIVDGRIAEVIKTNILDGTFVVPQFVLHEVQMLADSSDELTRAKGKRGLQVLQQLQQERKVPITILDHHAPPTTAVDNALVALARIEHFWLITNDANLQHIAELQHVRTVNLHQVADALRQPFVSGDTLQLMIRQEGREREQGVGFLHDGTMVVVEDARQSIGQELSIVITRVYQTNTGRILFAQPVQQTRNERYAAERAVP